MFGDWMLRLAAHLAGFSQQQLDRIGRAMPATRRLIALIVKAQPLIQKIAPIANDLTPLIKQALPILEKAMPLLDELVPLVSDGTPMVVEASKEFQSIGPALNIVMAVIEKDLEQGQNRDDVLKNVVSKIESAFSRH